MTAGGGGGGGGGGGDGVVGLIFGPRYMPIFVRYMLMHFAM